MEISGFSVEYLWNCEVKRELKWPKTCVISDISRTFRPVGNLPVQDVVAATTGAIFQINNAKRYVPVVTLSINDNIPFLENIKRGFKRNTSWNKFRSEITTQTKKQ